MATSVTSSSPTSGSAANSTTATTSQLVTATGSASNNAVTKANKASAQKLITSLGSGSGVDVASLAQNLVDAERAPKENSINAKITKSQARISGYSAVSYVLSQVNTALTSLKDAKGFNTVSASNSSSAFNVTTSADAKLGSHDVDVYSLAKAQRTVSSVFPSATQSLNGGKAITLSLRLGVAPSSKTTDISLVDGKDTPQSLVDAINASNTGVTAQLANTGDPANPYKMVLIGPTGTANAFTLTPKYSLGGVGSGTDPMNNGQSITVKMTLPTPSTVSLNPTITQGGNNQTETASVQFADIPAGATVTVGGQVLTATTSLTGADVAAAFATGTAPPGASFSGSLSGFSAGVANNGQVVFTATTANTNVTDLTASVTTPTTVKTVALGAGNDTPNAMIAAINAATDGNGQSMGLTAQLVPNPDGSTFPNKIFISGGNGFKVEADYGSGFQTLVQPASLSFSSNQSASDAQISVDGVAFTRSSNTFSDVLTGVTFDLKGVTTTKDANGVITSNTGTVSFTRDNTAIKTNINALVSAYNDAMTIFGAVTDPKSTLDTYGATLVGDSTVRMLKQQLRDMLTKTSSTPGSSISALWQMGVSIDQKGVMSLDNTKLDTALTNSFDDVVKTFTGNQNYLTQYSKQSGGIAGDAFLKIGKIISSTGVIATQTQNTQTQITKYQDDLTKLQTRMDSLLARYQKQFASMDSLVGSIKSQQTSLTSAFQGMMAMYTNKN
jgi:flagellar hook-associated protein 2